jgi:hypothetical protein
MLYGYRFKIELGFRQAVHLLGACAYHFWMGAMKPLKRGSGDQYLHRTSDAYRAAIRRKMAAFHVHVQLGCIAQGLLQHLSMNYTAEVWLCFRSWLRTMNPHSHHQNSLPQTPSGQISQDFSHLPNSTPN